MYNTQAIETCERNWQSSEVCNKLSEGISYSSRYKSLLSYINLTASRFLEVRGTSK